MNKIEKTIYELKNFFFIEDISYQTKIIYIDKIIWDLSKLKWILQSEKWPCDLCIDVESKKSLNNYCWNCWRKI